ncbi:uncharacterized protein N7515_000106 [Penicillium bovifimosum]|uniref:Uncharacterized protein n=1 Tax=Penicillium bovifimosum TaxID=126998 RepID=A0A9W9LAT4_9EURO|nr:uncharacterized protein N7515_000106 [Penicillium bovifimosum]KAJ5145542.1 hypothetical protein N7515_000106 [Penicillium bovifimosum]
MSLEHNPQNAPPIPDADTYKEVAAPYPPRPTIEHSLNDDCTLQVNDQDCTLEFSDRDCNLALSQYPDDKRAESGIAAVAAAGNGGQADGRLSAIEAKHEQDPEIESMTGTVKRHRSHRREWIIFGSVLGTIVVLVVVIVPSAIFGTRQSRPQYRPPRNPYIS